MLYIFAAAALAAFAVFFTLCVKYFALEQYGTKATGTIIRKEQEQPVYMQSRTVTAPILQALVGRHQLEYRYDDAAGQRHFGLCRVDDELHYHTKVEDAVEVLYLPKFPAIHVLTEVIGVRFRELTKIGGLMIGLVLLAFAWRATTGVVAELPEKTLKPHAGVAAYYSN